MTEGSWVEIGGGYSIGGGGGGFIRTDLLSVCTRIVRTHLLAPTTTVPATGGGTQRSPSIPIRFPNTSNLHYVNPSPHWQCYSLS